MAIDPVTLIKAQAIAAGIKGMIGESPEIQVYDDYAEIVFTETQRRALIAYLDSQVQKLFGPRTAPAPQLQVRLGSVLIPWSVRYLAPVAVALFLMGFMSNAIIFGRKG
jgi:hypothetical protein